ncbi:ParA family protein [Streptosporangium sp. NPDC002524]|uniref:ParA family protein n=1 Tax=Streptosporangium sp. NPDC002524 TaxID=3154537 RepID=UPI00331B9FD5
MSSRRYPNGPLVIGWANEGGGTRKTSDTVNTAVALARMGYEVAVLDADQTMAASGYLGYGVTKKKDNPERAAEVYTRLATMTSVYQVLLGDAKLLEAMVPARTRIDNGAEVLGDDDDSFAIIPNLRLVLGSREMAQASEDLRSVRKPLANNDWLRRAVYELPPGELDILCVDFRGTFDTLENTLLAACDYVIGAVKPDVKDEDTLELLRAVIAGAQEAFKFSGGAADMRHIMINGVMPKNRGRYYEDIVTGLEDYYGDMVLPMISENVNVASSVEAQEPVHFWLGPESKPAKEFDAAARALDMLPALNR